MLEADGGTLFLDEIGDMPLALQTRLLRVLESGEVSPLGSGKTRIIDVQVIAATNQNLRAQMQDKTFRPDLYHRLSGFVVNMVPLRKRGDKQEVIFNVLNRLRGDREIELAGETLARLNAYPWPGNIRELNHVLQRAIQLCENGVIRENDLLLQQETDKALENDAGHPDLEANARAIRFATERRQFHEIPQPERRRSDENRTGAANQPRDALPENEKIPRRVTTGRYGGKPFFPFAAVAALSRRYSAPAVLGGGCKLESVYAYLTAVAA